MIKGNKMKTRKEQIVERQKQMPRIHRANYDKAMKGKSRKSAMHAFCVECCGYQINEVYLCVDLGCPLYPYRPHSRVSTVVSEDTPKRPELMNSGKGV